MERAVRELDKGLVLYGHVEINRAGVDFDLDSLSIGRNLLWFCRLEICWGARSPCCQFTVNRWDFAKL